MRPQRGGARRRDRRSLVGDRRLSLKVDRERAAQPRRRSYTVVGKPLLRPDVPDKCTGRHTYVQDFTVPGMLHAPRHPPAGDRRDADVGRRVVDPRRFPTSASSAIENFLAVVAKDEWAAVRAARRAEGDVERVAGTAGQHAASTLYPRNGAVERDQTVVEPRRRETRDGRRGREDAFGDVLLAVPEPRVARPVVRRRRRPRGRQRNRLVVVAGHARPARRTCRKCSASPPEKVRVVFLDGSGSYGTNGDDHVAADAVLLSKTIGAAGARAVDRGRTRHGWDPKGPQQLLDVRAGARRERPHRRVGNARCGCPTTAPRRARAARGRRRGHPAGSRHAAPARITQNGDPPLRGRQRARASRTGCKETPLQLSNLRAPGKIANVFAVEGFTDELAAAAGVDAVDFRLQRLTDPRAHRRHHARRGGVQVGRAPSPNPRASAGAISSSAAASRTCATSRPRTTSRSRWRSRSIRRPARIQVRRVVCAHDCGLIVNPDALRNQVEGCIVQTLSRALHEEVTFDRSRVTSVDWVSYPILRFPEAPAVDVILIDRPDQPLVGAGEAATAPVAAALANAVFDATGVRLRTVPFTAERVKAALANE